MRINTPRQRIDIRVTPSGLIRVSEVMEPIKDGNYIFDSPIIPG